MSESRKEKRSSVAGPILAILLTFVGFMLAAYVTGYFCMGRYIDAKGAFDPSKRMILRRYPNKWQKTAFKPLSVVEGWLRGEYVGVDNPPPPTQADIIKRAMEEAEREAAKRAK